MSHTFAELLASKTLRGLPVDAPLRLSPDAGPTELVAVLEQFAVATSPRYQRDAHTYCNIFLWDFTRAAGCEVPHWVFDDGTPATPYQVRVDSKGNKEIAHELNANAVTDWLEQHGAANGWRVVDALEAQDLADNGGVAIFAWKNPTGGSGHVGAVRPGNGRPGIWFAQAGADNSSDIAMAHVFLSITPTFYARSNA
jgi:hypothetical protein